MWNIWEKWQLKYALALTYICDSDDTDDDEDKLRQLIQPLHDSLDADATQFKQELIEKMIELFGDPLLPSKKAMSMVTSTHTIYQ